MNWASDKFRILCLWRHFGLPVALALVIFSTPLNVETSQATGEQKTTTEDALACYRLSDDRGGNEPVRTYLLSPGDQLQILVYQREDLSGSHEIGEDGKISLPLVGRIHASGNSQSEVESLVATAIEQKTGRKEDVSIQLSNRRPIYVVGLVNRPGAYPFSPDMAVLHAIALSGGFYRPGERAGGIVGVSRENARISESTLRLKQALALHARLEAELAARPDLAPPQRLVALEGQNGARQFMSRQTRIMQNRASIRDKQLWGLNKAAELTRQEIKSLAEREDLIVDQLKLAREELGAADALRQKGLLRRSNLFTIQRIIAGLESDRRAVQARIVGAERNLLETEERIQLFDISQDLALEQEIYQAEVDIAATESAIRSSQWIVGELNAAASDDGEEPNTMAVTYRVIRSIGKRHYKFDAEELTPLCPGDIVRVLPGLN